MEKRSAPRHPMDTSLCCSLFRSLGGETGFEGRMKNCSRQGLCAELASPLKEGTAVIVRASKSPRGLPCAEGFRWLALAEVRWSRPKPSAAGAARYATGLKYLAS